MIIKEGNKSTTAYSKVLDLLDPGSFMETGEHISARLTSFYAPDEVQESDGVITGYGTIDDNLVFVYAQDEEVMGGTFGEMHGRKIFDLYDHAIKAEAPVIGILNCSGFRVEEGLVGLEQFGKLYSIQTLASEKIPQITCITGNCGGGMSLSAVIADYVFIEKDKGSLFVNPSSLIQEGEDLSEISAFDDGHYEWSEIVEKVRTLIGILPTSASYRPDPIEPTDDLNRSCTNIGSMLGDGRAMLREIADDHFLFESKPDKGEDMITGFIRLNGQPVGACCCNEVNGKRLLSYQGLDKVGYLARTCKKFNLPFLTIIYTDGYEKTASTEANLPNSARRLVRQIANAHVPQINVIAGDVFGSAYSLLNSKGLNADYVFVWDDADVSLIDPEQAVEMMYGEYNEELVQKYKESYSSPLALARGGFVDKIIKPEDTRKYIIGALETFVNSR